MTNIMNLIAIVLTIAALAVAVAAVGGTLRVYAQRYTGGLVVALPCAVATVTFFATIAVALKGPEYVFATLACGAVGMKVAWVVSMVFVEMGLELLEDKDLSPSTT